MNTPRSPTTPSKGKNKRPASTHPNPPSPSSTPLIIQRHTHRRRNVAAPIWGHEASPPPLRASLRTHPPRFNIYKALLRHPNLFFQFALRLPLHLILSLYAIDKEFHYRLNKYSVSLMHDYARYHAPLASRIFAWILYPELCISDPMLRPMDGRAWLARDVPGFRWLGMVMWRERVVRLILTEVGREGGRVPEGVGAVLMKFWCVVEMDNSAMRGAVLGARHIWHEGDFFLFALLWARLCARFAHPVLGGGGAALVHLLLSQRSLSVLARVLTRRRILSYDGVAEMVLRTYAIEELDTDAEPWLDDELDSGVPEEEWGLLSRENWVEDGEFMESAVDMVFTEGIRRGLNVQGRVLDFVLWGYVDGEGRNVPIPRRWRGDRKTMLPAEGWPREKERRSAIKELDGRFGMRDEEEDDMDVDEDSVKVI